MAKRSIHELKQDVLHKKTHTAPGKIGFPMDVIDTSDQSQEAMRQRAKMRAPHYRDMSPEDQWAEDKRLGILDWDGS
jgi:hypothetical protein